MPPQFSKIMLALFICTHALHAQLIVVNSTGDDPAVNPTTSPLTAGGMITLRSAIQFANANADPSNIINFNIPTSDLGYSTVPIPHWTIAPFSALDQILKPLTIDGYAGSPGGATPNTDPLISNAVITIELTGINIPANTFSPGLVGENCVFKGLCINSFTSSLSFAGPSPAIVLVSNSQITGNFIGTDITGMTALENNQAIACFVPFNAINCIVGTSNPADRNILVGDLVGAGVVSLSGLGNPIFTYSRFNAIQNNIIGLAKDGITPIGINHVGVSISGDGASRNIIGGSLAQRNIIANTIDVGINISSVLNTVQNNYVGMDVTGRKAISVGAYGISINASANLIEDNVITSATVANILVINNNEDPLTGEVINPPIQNQIVNNYIGTDATGYNSLSPDAVGIQVYSTQDAALEVYYPFLTISNNLVSGNRIGIATNTPANPVTIDTLSIVGNKIGSDISGKNPLPNLEAGIMVTNSQHIDIGSLEASQSNLIAFNGGPGILIDEGSTQNSILGNTITSNATYGVLIEGQSLSNSIGANQIINNAIFDVFVHQQSHDNVIQGNTISGANKGVVIGDNATDLSINNAVLFNAIAA